MLPRILHVRNGSFQAAAPSDLDREFRVERVANASEAAEALAHGSTRLILFDAPHLGRPPALREIERLRGASSAPIVVVCETCTEGERILALRRGADDFFCAEHSPAEVLERIRAKIRPAREAGRRRVYAYEDFEADFDYLEIRVDGRLVDLTRRELQLLEFLIEHPGCVHSRSFLLTCVWRTATVNDARTVDAHVRRLRVKLRTAARYIETVPGLGYRFAAWPSARG